MSLISLFIPLSTLDSKLACNDKRLACLTLTRTFLETFKRVNLQIFFLALGPTSDWDVSLNLVQHDVQSTFNIDEKAGGSMRRSHDRASSSEQALAATQ